MAKLESFKGKQTKWEGLWYHPEFKGYSSCSLSLKSLKDLTGNVRLCVFKNKYKKKGDNRPDLLFMLKSSSSEIFNPLEIEDEDEENYAKQDKDGTWRTSNGEKLFTYDEVEYVKDRAVEDGNDGYYPEDVRVDDFIDVD